MDEEVYNIIKKVLHENDLKVEYDKMEYLIKETLKEEHFKRKTELLESGLEMYYDIYTDEETRSRLSINTINLICLVQYKLFFDSVLKMNEYDLMTFNQIYTLFHISGINESVNRFLKLLYNINDLLENNIKKAFYNYESIDADLFEKIKKEIENNIGLYQDDGTDWNKID